MTRNKNLLNGSHNYVQENKQDIMQLWPSHKNSNDEVRVAFYARVSTEQEAQLEALKNQIAWVDDILDRHKNWKLLDENKYIDEGITGTQTKKRPKFLKMLKDAEAGKFDLIITREVSRFARNTVQSLDTVDKLKRMGIEVYFVFEDIWSFDSSSEFRLSIMSMIAQEESHKTSDRVLAGQKISRDKSVLYGNGNILGYKRVKDMGTYIIDEEQADTVRRIFELYLQGYGCIKISKILEAEHRKCSNGEVSWSQSKISRVLNNSTYKGVMAYGKSRSDNYLTQNRMTITDQTKHIYKQGNFPAIIEPDIWDACEKIRISKTVVDKEEQKELRKRSKKAPEALWVKKLRCTCGASFRKNKWRTKKSGDTVFGYQCYQQVNHGSLTQRKKLGLDTEGSCDIKMVADWKLDLIAKMVLEQIWTERTGAVEKAYEIVLDCYSEEIDTKQEEIAAIKKKMSKLEIKLENLVDMRSEGEITKDRFLKSKEPLEQDLKSLEQELNELNTFSTDVVQNDINNELESIKEIFNAAIDFTKPRIAEGFVDCFIAQMLVCKNDTFEVEVNFEQASNIKVACGVEGKKTKNIAPRMYIMHDGEIKYLDEKSPPFRSMQHRQRSTILGLKTETAEKPLKLGTFVIRKDYLSEYKKYHPETRKVNGWKDIVLIITFFRFAAIGRQSGYLQ